jgi:BirA family biotin operon repressor/biotin-[acetyl-CoA-carboxylase] ligase
MNIIKTKTCVSTNLQLKELANQQVLEEGTVLVCGEQTAGRGQKGNCWEAEPDKNLTFSLIFYPEFLAINDYFLLSKCVAMGVKTALDTRAGNISVKWPNDIYYRDKKIAGILIENEIAGNVITRSIVGIGVNINQEIFLSDAPNPVSLKQITGKETDVNVFLEEIIASVEFFYKQLQRGKTEQLNLLYQNALYGKEEFFLYKDKEGIFPARIESVANNGFIYLIDRNGEKRSYTFKEVALAGKR